MQTLTRAPKNWRSLDLAAKSRLRWLLRARPNQLTPDVHVLCSQPLEACEAALTEAKPIKDPLERAQYLKDHGHFDWMIWLLLMGRSTGKTRTGAEDIKKYMLEHPGCRVALVAATFGDGRKIMYEGESGLLAVIPSKLIAHYNRSMGEMMLTNGSQAFLFSAEQPERLRGPQFHRAWCLSPGTPVMTPNGVRPIERIQTGDLVITAEGPRSVVATGERTADLWSLKLADGRRLTGSAEHPIATSRGWVPLANVRSTDTIWVWPDDGDTTEAGTSTATKAARRSTSTGSSTSNTTASSSHRTTTSITATKSETTTGSRTWNFSPPGNTGSITKSSGTTTAADVASPTGQRSTTRRPSGAQPAEALSPKRVADCQSSTVSSAERSSSADLGPTPLASIAVAGAATPVGRQGSVHNLTVEGEHHFFANGILTHNCDELASWTRIEETWTNLQFTLRLGDFPKVVITGTPRPIPKIRELHEKSKTPAGGVVLATGKTTDNAANLPPSFLAELLDTYEGTRTGRQELDGEILEDMEGAFWNLSMIEDDRLPMWAMPDWTDVLGRTVVGVDPAGSHKKDSDETGIVVVAMTRGNCPFCHRAERPHAIVLFDDSGIYTPNEWALRTDAAFKLWQADRVIAERNYGGDMVRTTLTASAPHLPISEVSATKSKKLRAEPVFALYERHKVHHWAGEDLSKLEKQMTTWIPDEPGAKSPDRLDALCWAIYELMLPKIGAAPTSLKDTRLKGRR